MLVDLEYYAKSKGIAKKSGFYFSLLGLSKAQKQALMTLYIFCREVDDIVDECREPAIAEMKIHFWLQEIERVFLEKSQHPLGQALTEICTSFSLEKKYFKEILNGMLMDLTNTRYSNFQDLAHYCYAVASCVGLLVIEVLGYQGSKTALEAFAKNLGLALQLVNIIRDVGEDVRRNRIYIPQSDLLEFEVTEQEIASRQYSDRFYHLMQFQAARARQHYQLALESLPVCDYQKQQPSLIMAAIYFDLLNELETSKFQVLHQKIKLTTSRKLFVALRSILKLRIRPPISSSQEFVRIFCGKSQ